MPRKVLKRRKRRTHRTAPLPPLTITDVIEAQRIADTAQVRANALRHAIESQMDALNVAVTVLQPKRRKKRAAWGSKKAAQVATLKRPARVARPVRKNAVRKPGKFKVPLMRVVEKQTNTAKVNVPRPSRKHVAARKAATKKVNAFG